MKKFLLLCLTTLFCSATTLTMAQSLRTSVVGIENDDGVIIYYELSSLRGGTDSWVTYNHDVDTYNSYSGKVVVPSNFISLNTTYDVVGVNDNAFYLSTGLTSVTLPASITSVGSEAFGGCTGLQSITVFATTPPICNDEAFEGVDTENCVLYVPEACVDIYSETDGWKDFTNIKVVGDDDDGDGGGDGNDGDGDDGTPLADGTKFFYDGLYYDVVSSKEKTIEVTYVSEKAGFIDSPEDFHYTGSFNIPETVTYEDVTYTVVGIGYYAFSGCNGLSAVTIPSSVTYIGDYGFTYCYLLTELTLPDGLTSIGESAFMNCSNLEEMVIPKNVTKLSNYLFKECSSLKKVSLPDGLTEIGNEAFRYCGSLAEITLPESVTSVGTYAFGDCTSLSSLTSLNTNPPSVSNANAFTNVPTTVCVLHVPEESIESYQTDNIWKVFTNVEAEGTVYQNYDVQTLAATNVTSTTARLNGMFIYSGSIRNANYSVYIDYWSNGNDVVTIYEEDMEVGENNTFYAEISGLSKNTTYGYRVRVVTSDGDTVYGNGESFITGNYDLEDGGIYYNIVSDDTCEVTWGGTIIWGGTPSYIGDITIPESVELEGKTYKVVGIGEDAFDTCINLTSVNLPSTIEYIDSYAFYCCNGLTEIVLPESVQTIWDYAFQLCYNLESVTLGNSVEYLGVEAFQECLNLKSVTLGNSIKVIGDNAFAYCALEEVVIPNSVTYLGLYAFTMNYELKKVTIGEGVTEIQIGTFYENKSLEEVVFVEENLKTIGNFAFIYCSSLSSIDLPNSLESIGTQAFAACTSLTSIVIPDNVTTLGYGAFMDCSSLTEVTIGSSITSLDHTFTNCSALEEVTSLNTTPPDCGIIVAFGNVDVSTCILYVPEGAYDDYSAADCWKNFGSIIEMIKFEVETYEATNVVGTSATLNGFVKEGYKNPISRKGFFFWSDDPNVVTTITIDDDSKEISYTLNSLTPETTYTYRAFAVTASGTTYGEDMEFTTLEDTTTGINGISLDDDNVEGIYSTSGQKLNATVKGVNIIRYTDGTVKKIYVK